MNKQAIIHRVAFAELCSCGNHGHIKYPDGTQSPEFLSYDQAMEVIDEAVQQKKMMADNAMVLREEIAGWTLFEEKILTFLRNMMDNFVVEKQPAEMIGWFLDGLDEYVSVIFDEYSQDGEAAYANGISDEKGRTLH